MIVIYLLLPLALLITVTFLILFVWATRDGQFDDVQTPQIRVMFDDERVPPSAPQEESSTSAERKPS
jgi:cbb3-type cytochrome oxidase maturation protein